MAQKKKKPAKVRKPMDPEKRRRLIRLGSQALLAFLLFGGVGAGYYYADQYVEQRVGFSAQPLIIVLKNRPAWMNDFLVEQIAAIARPLGAHSSFDHKLLVDTAEMLGRNPWVKKVRSVRRAFTHKPGDTLEVDCDYRAPVALVKSGPFYWLVDEVGIRLSERFTEEQVPSIQFGPDGKTCIRVIEGVALSPPHLSGEQWHGQDLVAGLKMVKYLFDLPYTQQILRVDVKNYMGRVNLGDPRLVLETSFHTKIWWGRPPSDDEVDSFIEVNTPHKLKSLRQIYEQYGRVDGGYKWLDIRFDQVGVPSEPTPPVPPAIRWRSAAATAQ
ncbi:MAG TPA: hypothetical protein VIM11_16215 [Tepidisphaeraceae bacterium]|jgi:hypothetical protein